MDTGKGCNSSVIEVVESFGWPVETKIYRLSLITLPVARSYLLSSLHCSHVVESNPWERNFEYQMYRLSLNDIHRWEPHDKGSLLFICSYYLSVKGNNLIHLIPCYLKLNGRKQFEPLVWSDFATHFRQSGKVSLAAFWVDLLSSHESKRDEHGLGQLYEPADQGRQPERRLSLCLSDVPDPDCLPTSQEGIQINSGDGWYVDFLIIRNPQKSLNSGIKDHEKWSKTPSFRYVFNPMLRKSASAVHSHTRCHFRAFEQYCHCHTASGYSSTKPMVPRSPSMRLV